MAVIEESAIIDGLRNGDENAYEYLYNTQYAVLCVFAEYYTKDAFAAETIVGDVIFNIWKNKEDVVIQSLRNYLLRAVKNRCVSHIETQKRQRRLKDYLGDQLLRKEQQYNDLQEYPLAALLEKELDLRIKESLKAMPELTLKIFELSRYSNMSYQQIADELGVSVDTVKYHMKSALARLRRDLKDYLTCIAVFFSVFFN